MFPVHFLIAVSLSASYMKVSCDYVEDQNYQSFSLFSQPFPELLDNNTGSSVPIVLHDNYKNLARSWCSFTQGMWLFYSSSNFDAGSNYQGYIKTKRGNLTSSKFCANLPDGGTITSLRHMTHANISRPAISFFTQTNGSLQQELFFDGSYISLSENITFAAYGFAGFNPWTIYSLPKFQGVQTCLQLPQDFLDGVDQDSGLALMSVNVNVSLQVGSVKMGCQGNEDFLLSPINTTEEVLFLGKSDGSVTKEPIPNLNKTMTNETMLEDDSLEINVTLQNGNKLSLSGNELVLPELVMVKEVEVMNGSYWELCTDLDFTGTCLCFNQTYGNLSLSLLSARRGCPSQFKSSSAKITVVNVIVISVMNLVVYIM